MGFSMRRGWSQRGRVEQRLASLALPSDWTLADLVEAVQTDRGRRLVMVPLPESAAPGLCGVWFATDQIDLVAHRRTVDERLSAHVIAHELGHILFDHGAGPGNRPDELASVLTGLDLSAYGLRQTDVRAARGVSDYDVPQEREAEFFATIVSTQATDPRDVGRDRLLRLI